MSQSTQSTFLSLEPSQWNPAEILNLNPKPNGLFSCSGVKRGPQTPCRWDLDEETASTIGNLLDNMSKLPPQDAIQSLHYLAAITLCKHHQLQQRAKVTEWTGTIRHILLLKTESNILELDGSSPPQRLATTPQSISSLPPYSNISFEPVCSDIRFRGSKESILAVQSSYVPLQKQIVDLQEEFRLQTERILILEATCREFTNATTSQKRFGGFWARLKACFRS
ncbi:hypothetical protein K491DRAFT_699810 [Lophiostoma macrostomum CBS 122681]|uniref:Uncharacterized protein n=1 Tax=Lophiostoma macrostomum CBS 122681 TaxID=1314788 RepID=A0A6A6SGZ4_9PLEO|nr:hypothetical protein K491DRAFT_699810 [Lophiostoma macrostomum CBS 122681]